MNSDLISRSELKKEFAKFDRLYIVDTGNELVNAFAVDKLIDNAPTVELDGYVLDGTGLELVSTDYLDEQLGKDRQRGEWQPISEGNRLIGEGIRHKCNQCKEYAPSFKDGSEHLTNFCPNCGAQMKCE